MSKHLLLLGFICFFPSLIFAQNKSTSWQKLKKEKGITVAYRYIECKKMNYGFDREIVILKITNSTNEIKIANWSLQAFRGKKCSTCNKNGEYDFNYKLNPKSSYEGSCKAGVDSRLKIFSKFLNPRAQLNGDNLSRFELADFKISCKSCNTNRQKNTVTTPNNSNKKLTVTYE